MNLLRQTVAGLRAMVALTLVLGVVYPIVVAVIANVTMHDRATGSVITVGGRSASTLIGQRFEGDQWLQPRPSAAGDGGYDGLASAGSNLGPNSTELRGQVAQRRAEIFRRDGAESIPADAVTASSSGLDPHISPEYAELQVARIARVRHLDEGQVRAIVARHTEGRMLGFLGEPRVNVVKVNADLAR
ncbi:potassium-transporting ATPase subunit KdpC [Mariniluteicoccus endophyticus]